VSAGRHDGSDALEIVASLVDNRSASEFHGEETRYRLLNQLGICSRELIEVGEFEASARAQRSLRESPTTEAAWDFDADRFGTLSESDRDWRARPAMGVGQRGDVAVGAASRHRFARRGSYGPAEGRRWSTRTANRSVPRADASRGLVSRFPRRTSHFLAAVTKPRSWHRTALATLRNRGLAGRSAGALFCRPRPRHGTAREPKGDLLA